MYANGTETCARAPPQLCAGLLRKLARKFGFNGRWGHQAADNAPRSESSLAHTAQLPGRQSVMPLGRHNQAAAATAWPHHYKFCEKSNSIVAPSARFEAGAMKGSTSIGQIISIKRRLPASWRLKLRPPRPSAAPSACSATSNSTPIQSSKLIRSNQSGHNKCRPPANCQRGRRQLCAVHASLLAR